MFLFLHSRVESDDTEDEAVRPKHVIDCGELVWALAFGSSSGISHPQPGGVHFRRFEHFTKDLILATGLQTGRIRIWCVNTGEINVGILQRTGEIQMQLLSIVILQYNRNAAIVILQDIYIIV